MTHLDRFERPLRDLRISVTDRCNYRCTYCMPKQVFGDAYEFLDREELLTYEQIARLARVFVGLGVNKIRLTGGEPLLRRDLERLVEMLVAIPGLDDLALTTNGVLLERNASALKAAGLRRVTVSLDSLDETAFQAMNDVGAPVSEVLAGIDAADEAGLCPIKINAVVRRGVNDHTVVDLARRFYGTGHVVRFIEYMDVGHTNGWRLDEVVPARQIVEMINRQMPLEPVESEHLGRIANRYRYKDGGGEIGVIASITEPFCSGCTRARLSPEGRLFTCLFASEGVDLREPVRAGVGESDLASIISSCWRGRNDRYSELRTGQTLIQPKIEMSYIGG